MGSMGKFEPKFVRARTLGGDVVNIKNAIRGEHYICIACGFSMYATGFRTCTGNHLQPHFRHKSGSCDPRWKPPPEVDPSKWDQASESQRHKIMKDTICSALQRSAATDESPKIDLKFMCARRGCTRWFRSQKIEPRNAFPGLFKFEDAKKEKRIPGTNRIADVVTIGDGPIMAIEVCHTHDVSEKKAEELKSASMPWVEVLTDRYNPKNPLALTVSQCSLGILACDKPGGLDAAPCETAEKSPAVPRCFVIRPQKPKESAVFLWNGERYSFDHEL